MENMECIEELQEIIFDDFNFGDEEEKQNNKEFIVENLSEIKDEDLQSYREALDPDQYKAVTAPFKNIIVRAVAGSGKTRVITNRLSYYIKCGIDESAITLITFTNKAANEMISRAKKLLGKDDIKILAGTFHHVAVIFLRKYAELLNYKNDFKILTPEDCKDVINIYRQKFLASNKNLKDLAKKFPKAQLIYSFYTKSKNLELTYDDINLIGGHEFSDYIMDAIKKILFKYETWKKDNNAMDFDDLLYNFYTLLLNFEEVRNKISRQHPFCLVDEYQDVNSVQANIVKLLDNGNNNLFVVGDINQGIYKFRGAKSEYIRDFTKHFEDCLSLSIKYNYRSQQCITDLASDFLQKETGTTESIIAYNKCMDKPEIVNCYTDALQIEYIIKKIRILRGKGFSYKDMAIPIRLSFLTKNLELALRKNHIPYKIIAGLSFFDRAHVRDMLAFIKFNGNQNDEIAFNRICYLFDGVREKTTERFYLYLKSSNFDFAKLHENIPFKVSTKAAVSVRKIAYLLENIFSIDNLDEKMNFVFKNFYEEKIKGEKDYYEMLGDVRALIDSGKLYKNIDKFLNDTVLESVENDEEEEDYVSILTSHKSKGLEWDIVFMPYMMDGVFPYKRALEEGSLDEEINLFYVSMTRACKYLYILFTGGYTNLRDTNGVSRFIECLDKDLYTSKRVDVKRNY